MNTYNISFLWRNKRTEPANAKTYNKTCATSEDSDQPAHPRSLIRVFADRKCLLQPIQRGTKGNPWVDIQANLSLCRSHRSYRRFCHALAQLLIMFPSYQAM